MGNTNTQPMTPSVEIENNCGKRIRAKVDCDRSFFLVTSGSIGASGGVFKGRISAKVEYDTFHIVPTSLASTIISNGSSQVFHPTSNGCEYAFLTIMFEKDDGSWEIYCENHQITKNCKIFFGKNLYVRQLNYSIVLGDPLVNRIAVYNRTSKKVWAHVDADKIEMKRLTATGSINIQKKDITYGLKGKIDVEQLVYYRAEQGVGYTLIKNEGTNEDYTIFYPEITTNQFFLSLDYEDENGKVVEHCLHHPVSYHLVYGLRTPHVYVEDDGKGIKFRIDRVQPSLHGGY